MDSSSIRTQSVLCIEVVELSKHKKQNEYSGLEVALADCIPQMVGGGESFLRYNQASACSRRPPGARPQAAKWVTMFFKKSGNPKNNTEPLET